MRSIAWSPDGNTIASGNHDGTIKLWDNKGEKLKTLKGHNNDVVSVAFNPDKKTNASASKDRTVKLWNFGGEIKPEKFYAEELQTLNGHKKEVASVSFSADGKTLVSTSDDKTQILWNLEDLKLEKLLKDGCQQVKDYLKYNAKDDEEKKLCKYDS